MKTYEVVADVTRTYRTYVKAKSRIELRKKLTGMTAEEITRTWDSLDAQVEQIDIGTNAGGWTTHIDLPDPHD